MAAFRTLRLFFQRFLESGWSRQGCLLFVLLGRNVLISARMLVKMLFKRSNPSTACPPRVLPPEKRPPEPPGPPPPPLSEADLSSAAPELNPAVTAALLQLFSQQEESLSHAEHHPARSADYGRSHSSRTYSTEGSDGGFGAEELNSGQTLLEPSAQTLGKSRTFLGSMSHLGEASNYQGMGSVQFPGDQDLRFTRVPVALHSVGQSFSKTEGSNNTLVHPEAKIQTYNELGAGTAGSSGAGTGHGWGAPAQAAPYGKAYRGPGRVPSRGGRGRGVPY